MKIMVEKILYFFVWKNKFKTILDKNKYIKKAMKKS